MIGAAWLRGMDYFSGRLAIKRGRQVSWSDSVTSCSTGRDIFYWEAWLAVWGRYQFHRYSHAIRNTFTACALTLPMLTLFLSKVPGCKDFWKTSKPFKFSTHWIALAEYSQMSTHLPGFQSFSSFFASFCIGQISRQQHRANTLAVCRADSGPPSNQRITPNNIAIL